MSNEFKRVPTCGENDVDLRVATEPRRAADRLTASVQFHELAQGYRAATPDGAQAAYEKLCAFLEKRESAMASDVDRNSVLEEVCRRLEDVMDDCKDRFASKPSEYGAGLCVDAVQTLKSATPQPVAAAQAVPEGLTYTSDDDGTVAACLPDGEMVWHANIYCNSDDFDEIVVAKQVAAMLAAAIVAQPTDTTKGA